MGSDFREILYTADSDGHRKWVYPALVRGFFYRRRQVVAYLLMAIYLSMPWVTIGGDQALRLDIAGRKLTAFGAVFWATDTQFMMVVLGALAFSLFFFTALFGRVWCGWACPETVFLEFLFRPIEILIEGQSAQRQRLDAEPWSLRKIRIKGTKYLAFSLLAWALASTFLAYFVGRHRLLTMMAGSPLENLDTFLMTLGLMGVVIFQFGWFREQFCTVLCPYARFQSVLMDSRSLGVGYDPLRGEPRGKLVRGERQPENGDCVDCRLCVRVCPTGIDIRNGPQLECIHCANCVDACDSVMVKIGRPTGLIRYDSEDGLKGKPTRLLKGRAIIYGAVLVVYAVAFLYMLLHRSLVEVQVVRGASDAPYSLLGDDLVSNHLSLKLSNKGRARAEFHVDIPGRGDVQVIIPLDPIPVEGGALSTLPVFFNFPRSALVNGRLDVDLRVTATDGAVDIEHITLLGPETR